MLELGNSPILTNIDEVKRFILDCIRGKALGQAKAFGKVGHRLAAAIMSVREDVNLNNSYLEINADSLREAYKRHSMPKEKGDIPLSESDFQDIPELLNDFDGVTSVDYFNGKVEAHIYKRTEDGYIRLITVVSSERKSLQVTKMVGVSQEKFESKYGKKIERDLANRRGQTEITDASNPSTTATSAKSLSKNSISHSNNFVNREKKVSIDPTWTDDKGRKHSYREKLNEKTVNIAGTEITLGEAIYLYMLTKREHAHAGLMEGGYATYDEKNNFKKKIKIHDVENVRSEIGNQLDEADRVYLAMAERFFNETSTRIKTDADMTIFGYTNTLSGYYVPIIRDRYSRTQAATDERQSIGSIVTVYNKSFNQNTVKNASLAARNGRNLIPYIPGRAVP